MPFLISLVESTLKHSSIKKNLQKELSDLCNKVSFKNAPPSLSEKTHTSALLLPTYFNNSEDEMALVQHDDFVFIGAIIHHMAKGEQGGRIGEDSTSPSRIPLMGNNQILLMGCDSFIQNSRVLIFIWRSEMILNRAVSILFISWLVI